MLFLRPQMLRRAGRRSMRGYGLRGDGAVDGGSVDRNTTGHGTRCVTGRAGVGEADGGIDVKLELA